MIFIADWDDPIFSDMSVKWEHVCPEKCWTTHGYHSGLKSQGKPYDNSYPWIAKGRYVRDSAMHQRRGKQTEYWSAEYRIHKDELDAGAVVGGCCSHPVRPVGYSTIDISYDLVQAIKNRLEVE